MREYTHISDAVELAKDKAEYDNPLKHILANKDVLAWIASRSVKELKGYPIDVIKNCIEGEPKISTIPVAPGHTNEAITGHNTEDNIAHEGTVYFDIRFTIITPGKERIRLILNVEAQKKFRPGYDLTSHNLSQVQLAEQLNVSKQTVSNWENNNILPSVEMLVKIALFFSVSTDYLLELDHRSYIEISGLTDSQLAHIQQIIQDILN